MRLSDIIITLSTLSLLGTIGIPTYLKMVQRANQVEAKVMLGSIYVAEQGFLAEVGSYGNNLKQLGIGMDGKPEERVYTVGFPTGSCSEAAIVPSESGTFGSRVTLDYPSYFSDIKNSLSQTRTKLLLPRLGQRRSQFYCQRNGYCCRCS